MSDSSIEWLRDPDGREGKTWNPLKCRLKPDAAEIAERKSYASLVPIIQSLPPGKIGHHCEKISPGCSNCYACAMNARAFDSWGTKLPYDRRSRDVLDFWLDEKELTAPLHWKKPRRVFPVSMSDAFGKWWPDEMIVKMIAVARLCSQHKFLFLSKRSDRVRDFFMADGRCHDVAIESDRIAVDSEMDGVREYFRPVAGYVGHYEVSNYGNVRSLKTDRILKPWDTKGRYTISLCKEAVVDDVFVHRLVLSAFCRPPQDGEDCRHRNRNGHDNRIANLSWGTKFQNMRDAARHGTAGAWMKGRRDFTDAQVAEIRGRRSDGELCTSIATDFGSTMKQISEITKGHIYRPPIEWPLPNCMLGFSAENQEEFDARWAHMRDLAKAGWKVWCSLEPLIGPVNVRGALRDGGLSWLVPGGESGHGARHLDVAWVADIIKAGKQFGIPVFTKQLGANPQEIAYPQAVTEAEAKGWQRAGWTRIHEQIDGRWVEHWRKYIRLKDRKGGAIEEWPENLRVRQYA